MEIDLKEHLSEETMQEIAEDEFRKYVRRQLGSEADLKRFLSNVAYDVVSEFCDNTLDNTMMDEITRNVERVVKGLSEYAVFKAPDSWCSETNDMYDFLQAELEKQKPEIARIVAENAQVQALDVLKGEVKHLIREAVQQHYGDIE